MTTPPTCEPGSHVLTLWNPLIDGTWCQCTELLLDGDHTNCPCHPTGRVDWAQTATNRLHRALTREREDLEAGT